MSERIRAEGLTKAYGMGKIELEVLKGIDITIEPGEMIAIHGPSGAGKSTLLHILGTLDRPTSGTVNYGDVRVDTLGEKSLARLRNENIGFIFQFYHLLPEFTALENVILPAMVKGKRLKEARARASGLLASVGLGDRENHKPDALDLWALETIERGIRHDVCDSHARAVVCAAGRAVVADDGRQDRGKLNDLPYL